jgi:hypothetical protein
MPEQFTALFAIHGVGNALERGRVKYRSAGFANNVKGAGKIH